MDPQFYAFRWITLCLAQEFAFPDTLRIWDTILSDPHGRLDCLLRICVSMIILARDRLLKVRRTKVAERGAPMESHYISTTIPPDGKTRPCVAMMM